MTDDGNVTLLSEIPPNRTVLFSLFSHAKLEQEVSIMGPDGQPISFCPLAGSASCFPLFSESSDASASISLFAAGWFTSPIAGSLTIAIAGEGCQILQSNFANDRGGVYAFGVSDPGSDFDSCANTTVLIRWEGPPLG